MEQQRRTQKKSKKMWITFTHAGKVFTEPVAFDRGKVKEVRFRGALLQVRNWTIAKQPEKVVRVSRPSPIRDNHLRSGNPFAGNSRSKGKPDRVTPEEAGWLWEQRSGTIHPANIAFEGGVRIPLADDAPKPTPPVVIRGDKIKSAIKAAFTPKQ